MTKEPNHPKSKKADTGKPGAFKAKALRAKKPEKKAKEEKHLTKI